MKIISGSIRASLILDEIGLATLFFRKHAEIKRETEWSVGRECFHVFIKKIYPRYN